jgi:hypothetical protein
MFARVTVIEGDPARFDEVKEFITSPQITWAARLAGQLLAR